MQDMYYATPKGVTTHRLRTAHLDSQHIVHRLTKAQPDHTVQLEGVTLTAHVFVNHEAKYFITNICHLDFFSMY